MTSPGVSCSRKRGSKWGSWHGSHSNKVMRVWREGANSLDRGRNRERLWAREGKRNPVEHRHSPWQGDQGSICVCVLTSVCECVTHHWEASMAKTSAWGLVKMRSSSGSEERWASRRSSTWQKSDTFCEDKKTKTHHNTYSLFSTKLHITQHITQHLTQRYWSPRTLEHDCHCS